MERIVEIVVRCYDDDGKQWNRLICISEEQWTKTHPKMQELEEAISETFARIRKDDVKLVIDDTEVHNYKGGKQPRIEKPGHPWFPLFKQGWREAEQGRTTIPLELNKRIGWEAYQKTKDPTLKWLSSYEIYVMSWNSWLRANSVID